MSALPTHVVHWWRDGTKAADFRPCSEATAMETAEKLGTLPGSTLVQVEARAGGDRVTVFCCHDVARWFLQWTPGVGTTRYETHRNEQDLRDAVGSLEALIAEGDPITWSWSKACLRCGAMNLERAGDR